MDISPLRTRIYRLNTIRTKWNSIVNSVSNELIIEAGIVNVCSDQEIAAAVKCRCLKCVTDSLYNAKQLNVTALIDAD